MPFDDLNRFLFQDFALEIERRKKLTVIGEHYYGAEQGRIITERPRVFDEVFKLVTEEPPVIPACPILTLVCDSISASQSKCGWGDCDGTSFWLRLLGSFTYTAECEGDGPPCSVSGNLDGTTDPSDCSVTFTEDSTVTYSEDDCPCGEGTCGTTEIPWEEDDFCSFGIPGSDIHACGGATSVLTSSTTRNIKLGPTVVGSAALSDEYTTAALIANAVAALPSYDDDFNDTCSAIRDLSSDESSYSIQRFKYKFTFASQTAYLKIFWTERFTPESGGAPTDTAKTWTHVAGSPVTESDTYEVIEPGADGTITIVNIRSSTSADCEPEISDECDPATADCTGHYQNCQCQ